jgi:hypothetical protein
MTNIFLLNFRKWCRFQKPPRYKTHTKIMYSRKKETHMRYLYFENSKMSYVFPNMCVT